MGRTTQVQYGGKQIPGLSLDFENVSEHWNEYKLENGGVVRVRVVPVEIVVTEERNQQGEPVVVVKSSVLVQYREPELGN